MLALCNVTVPTPFFFYFNRMLGLAIDVIGSFDRSDRLTKCAAVKLALGEV